jgi:hypothetical protein
MFLALILSLSRKLCFVFCLIALCNPSSGQDFPVPVLIDADQERYTTALLSILRDWESGKITFQKTSNLEETFIGKMSDFQGRQQQFYVESSLPMEKFIIENWQRLPEELKANKPLSMGAILLLVASIVDSEPIREVWIHDEGFAASRLSMMRIMARRMKATVVRA